MKCVPVYCLFFLLLTSFLQAQKSSFVDVYPSLHGGYGFLFNKMQTSDNGAFIKYYNANYTAGVQLNVELKTSENVAFQLYGGYTKWSGADLFPVGVMLKSKINQQVNSVYVKLGAGYSFGKRYFDENEPFRATALPSDYGRAGIHAQAGLEKSIHAFEKSHISIGFLLNVQLIKSYAPVRTGGGPALVRGYFIPYKFAVLTFAYHFSP